MSRRDQIRMSDEEVATFLDEQRTVICATNGRDGWPHLMPLWYVVRDGHLWSWTYAKAQKTRNLERDSRASSVCISRCWKPRASRPCRSPSESASVCW